MRPDELATARWFRAKHRPIAAITDVDRVPIGPGALVVFEVDYLDGAGSDRYLVPLVGESEPLDGEGLWAALADAIGSERRIGPFVGSLLEAFEPVEASAERRLTVEQSNTSVVLDERLILKLYRLLEPGANPDVEVSAYLADAGFADTPALLGAIAYAPLGREPAAAAMLQAYVPSTGDAWGAVGSTLAVEPSRGVALVAEIGGLTARMHAALASRPADAAFPARPATVAETGAWRASAEHQLADAVGSLDGENHARLGALAPAVTARFADAFGAASGMARVTRIHGDYHLGQLLARTDGGFSVIDFEGEPARPLAERRLPGSPLRDVAGMLRSLDYAARTSQRDTGLDADAWLTLARAAFLEAYGRVGPSESALVDAFELEKACYEVRYEAANRPDWLWLPLAAIERLVARR